MRFAIDSDGWTKGDGRNIVLIRMALAPGKHSLERADGSIVTPPFAGIWHAPLGLEFEVQEKSVIYLGRIAAELRPRKDDEFRAGFLLPLFDQSVTGVSTGTFDVLVSDQSEIDLPAFRQTFPVLKNVEIQKTLLPAVGRSVHDRAFQGKVPPKVEPVASKKH